MVLLTCLCAVGAGAELFDVVELDGAGAAGVESDGLEALELEGAGVDEAEAVQDALFVSRPI